MGEARINRKRHAAILRDASGCIYCACERLAEQVDHMPPRSMFRLSQRPKGLEFPSCATCNQGTSRLDVVATFLSRTFPAIDSERDEQEWQRVIKEMQRVAPEILSEMWLPEREMEDLMHAHGWWDPKLAVFKADGPVLAAYMQAFAAKVGFALFYERHGSAVPKSGGVQVRWFTSGEIYEDSIPRSLFESVGKFEILKQGKINSHGTFEYSWGNFIEKSEVEIFYAKIRQAFMVAAFVVQEYDDLPFKPGELATFRSGELAGELHDRIYD